MLQISLFGELAIRHNGEPLPLPKSRKIRGLLAYLTLTPGGSSRQFLADLLFPDVKDAKASLRWAISQLRSSLPLSGVVDTSLRDKLALDFTHITSDLAELRHWLTTLDNPNPKTNSLEVLRHQAAEFEQGLENNLLANLAIDESADFESWRLTVESAAHRQRQQLLSMLLTHTTVPAERVELARRLVNLDTLQESHWAMLVDALCLAGQLQEAQRTSDLAHQTLRREQIPIVGKLDKAITDSSSTTPNTALAAVRKHRTTLAVMGCTATSGQTTPELLNHMSDALHSAANSNRTCALLARSLTRNNSHHNNLGLDDPRSTGVRIGADLVMESRLQQNVDSYRLTIELISVSEGTCLFNWDQTFTETTVDQLIDKVFAFFAARFEIDMHMALIALAHTKTEEERGLWDQYFLALPRIYSPEGHDPVESLALLQQVIDSEPSMGPAVCAAAWVRTTHPQFNESPQNVKITATMARRAIELCQDDTFIVGLAAIVIATTERDLVTAQDLVKRALTFNPHSTIGLAASGIMEHYLGRHTQALALFNRAMNAINTEPLTFIMFAFGSLAHYFNGDPQSGLELARKACGRNPTFVVGRRALVLCTFGCGDIATARLEAQNLINLDPSEHLEFYQRQSPYRNSADLQKLCHDLQQCGVPEHGPLN